MAHANLFPRLSWWLSGKESACNAGDTGDASSVSGLRKFSGGRHGSPLQYSCLENPMDRGAWQARLHETVHGVTKSQMRLRTHNLLPVIFFSIIGLISYISSIFSVKYYFKIFHWWLFKLTLTSISVHIF